MPPRRHIVESTSQDNFSPWIQLRVRRYCGIDPSTMAAPTSKGIDMQYEEFITRVAQSAGVSQDTAAALTRATLATLAERISGGEARDLAAQLPARLQTPLMGAEEQAEKFSFEEFVARTQDRAGVDAHIAEVGVEAVLATLRDAVSPGEFDDVLSQLPAEFHGLGARRPH
jgi:uncharacterized protein (DUF2267 family)